MLGSLGGHAAQSRVPILLGAAALGWAHKEGWLQKLPLIGRAGPVTSFGLLGWGAEQFLKLRLPKLVHDGVTAALAISAFNMGLTAGTPGGMQIVGEDPAFAYPGGAVFFD